MLYKWIEKAKEHNRNRQVIELQDHLLKTLTRKIPLSTFQGQTIHL